MSQQIQECEPSFGVLKEVGLVKEGEEFLKEGT
jgi:hypothetical protein